MSRFAFEQLDPIVRVDDHTTKVVVYVGSAPRGVFVPSGTGFLVAIPENDYAHQYIVTARHVVDNAHGDEILIRLNMKSGEARTIPTRRDQWHIHDPAVDLAICPVTIGYDTFDILHIAPSTVLTKEVIRDFHIGIGSDIYVCGLFLSNYGETRNIPIVRSGIISAMPGDKIRTSYGFHDAYLIEARSIDGISGSPVYAHMGAWRVEYGPHGSQPNVKMNGGALPAYFLGMVLGASTTEYPAELVQFLPEDDRAEEDKKADQDYQRVPLNTGIAIVLPWDYIFSAIHSEPMKKLRDIDVAAIKHASGYRPSSASRRPSSAEPKTDEPSSDSNPAHREAFNSLLDAAAKTKRQDD